MERVLRIGLFIKASAAMLAVCALAAAVWDLWSRFQAPRYNVILLSVESIRADRIHEGVWPNVLAASRQGARFHSHRAVSAWTGTNAISLLTGLSPYDHAVHTRDESVDPDFRLPLEILSERGWLAAGLQSFMRIDTFRNLGLRLKSGEDPFAWLGMRRQDDQPFFLWYHYLQTHLPYAPPDAFRPDWPALLPNPQDAAALARIKAVMTQPAIPAGSIAFEPGDRAAINALYDGNLRAFDAWFKEFWTFFKSSGLSRDTILILTADHGEELLERGHVGHASTTRDGHMHEELVHLPLFIWWPENMRAPICAGDVRDDTDHLDIMATIIALLAPDLAPELKGRDLARCQALAPRPWIGVTSKAGFSEPDTRNLPLFIHAAKDGPWKLQWRLGGGEDVLLLHNLASDPGERRNLAAIHPDIVARLRALLEPSARAMKRPPPPALSTAVAPAAAWVRPAKNGAYRYEDLEGDFRLVWTGLPAVTYRLQYEAGEGALRLAGEIVVEGNIKDFGAITKNYWDTWIKPYRSFRIRVTPVNDPDGWSEWITLEAR